MPALNGLGWCGFLLTLGSSGAVSYLLSSIRFDPTVISYRDSFSYSDSVSKTAGPGVALAAISVALNLCGSILSSVAGYRLRRVPAIGKGACCCVGRPKASGDRPLDSSLLPNAVVQNPMLSGKNESPSSSTTAPSRGLPAFVDAVFSHATCCSRVHVHILDGSAHVNQEASWLHSASKRGSGPRFGVSLAALPNRPATWPWPHPACNHPIPPSSAVHMLPVSPWGVVRRFDARCGGALVCDID